MIIFLRIAHGSLNDNQNIRHTLWRKPSTSVQPPALEKVVNILFKECIAYFANLVASQKGLYVTLDKMIIS